MLKPRTTSINYNINLYTKGLSFVLKKTQSDNVIFEAMEKQRNDGLRSWAQSQNLSSSKVRSWITKEFGQTPPLLNESRFQKLNDEPAPLLKIPAIMNRRLRSSSTASHHLLEILSGQKKISGIRELLLQHSILNDTDLHFRTDLYQGQSTIFGNDIPKFRSVTSLAHELGHLIVETGTLNPVQEHKHSLVGEIFAHCIEKLVGYYALESNSDKKEWLEWCEAVDDINIFFFFWEVAEANGQPLIKCPFSRQSLVLRQTLYCTPGYQWINAYSSLIRRRLVLNQEGL